MGKITCCKCNGTFNLPLAELKTYLFFAGVAEFKDLVLKELEDLLDGSRYKNKTYEQLSDPYYPLSLPTEKQLIYDEIWKIMHLWIKNLDFKMDPIKHKIYLAQSQNHLIDSVKIY